MEHLLLSFSNTAERLLLGFCNLCASILCFWGRAEHAKPERPILAIVHDMEMGIAICNTHNHLFNIKKVIHRELTIPFAKYPHLDRHLNDLYGKILIRECEIIARKAQVV